MKMNAEHRPLEDFVKRLLNTPLYLSIAVYLVIIVLNFPSMTNPPYWDDIMGLHNQAVWLAKHNFDFSELWSPGQSFWDGGQTFTALE